MPKAAKTAPTNAPKSADSPFAPLVEELAQLQIDLAPHRGKISREEAIKKQLRAKANEWPAEIGGSIAGIEYDAVLGPRKPERSVNVAKLFSLLRPSAFLPLVKIAITALEEAKISADVQARVIETRPTGSRDLAIRRKA